MTALFANNATTTLAAGVTSGATTITVPAADAGLFPAPTGGDWFPLTVTDYVNMEIMRCTGRSGASLTVVRAQEGTVAAAFATGAIVEHRLTKAGIATFLQVADWTTLINKPATFPPTLPIPQSGVSNLDTALGLKANLDSPALTGTPTGPTAAQGTNTTQLATTAFVTTAINANTEDWSAITGKPATFPPTLPIAQSGITNLSADLALKAPLDSPIFSGNPTTPTPVISDNDLSIANTAFVQANLALIGGRAVVSATPPVSPVEGQLWWDSESGNIFVYYTDPSGPPGQWVISNSITGPPGTGGAILSEFTFTSTTTFPPGSGQIRFNNATQNSTTEIFLSGTTAPGVDAANIIPFALPSGADILVQDKDDATKYKVFSATADPVKSGSDFRITVTLKSNGADLSPQRVILGATRNVAGGGGLTQATADGLYVNTAGDTMAGTLTFSVSPLAPTPTAGDNTTKVATTAFVTGAASAKEPTIAGGTTAQYWRGDKSWQTLDKTAVGLANVDNTSDANKPVSTATTTQLNLKEATANKGVASGYAALDASGKIPSIQLPSYVDDVQEFANLAAFPGTGATGIIYVDLATNKVYRWGGSSYIEISSSPGSTDQVPEGSVNLYHTTARASAAAPVQSVATRTGAVTLAKADVGLSNVDNTSDANKPVSTATTTQLNLKAPIASPTFTGKVTTAASAAGSAGFILPPGAAPTTPANGDLWTTTAGIYVQVNGGTVGPLAKAAASSATYQGYLFNTSTTPPPAAGGVRLNNATHSSATILYISYTNEDGVDLKTYFVQRVKVGDQLYLQDRDDPTKWHLYEINAAYTDNTTYASIPITWKAGNGTLPGQRIIVTREGVAAAITTLDWTAITGKPSTFPPTTPIAQSSITNLTTDLGLKAPIASPTFTGKATTAASASGGAGLNLPHGAAPTSPVNGDIWTTTAAVFARINGSTQQISPGWTQMTQAAYDALTPKDANLLYVIVG